MKLRNKKTGEIIELLAKPSFVKRNDDYLLSEVNTFNSLAELNEEWEDYEEPKEYWIIDTVLNKIRPIADKSDEEWIRFESWAKEIGNYFETKEEADKALEKLKAWKRLKDKGFKFISCDDRVENGKLFIVAKMPILNMKESQEDLDLLFGGEE